MFNCQLAVSTGLSSRRHFNRSKVGAPDRSALRASVGVYIVMLVVWIVASVIFTVFVATRYASVLERPCERPFPSDLAAATLSPPRLNRRGQN